MVYTTCIFIIHGNRTIHVVFDLLYVCKYMQDYYLYTINASNLPMRATAAVVDNPNIALRTGMVCVIPQCGSLSFLGGLDGFLRVTLPVLNGSVCSTPTPSVINRWIIICDIWIKNIKQSTNQGTYLGTSHCHLL